MRCLMLLNRWNWVNIALARALTTHCVEPLNLWNIVCRIKLAPPSPVTPEALLRRLEEKEERHCASRWKPAPQKQEQQLKRGASTARAGQTGERALKEREREREAALNSENEKGSSKSGVEVVAKAIIYTKHK